MMMTIEEIKKAVAGTDHIFYGIRKDDYGYTVGDTAFNSHQIYQDPDFDEDDELVYPYIENGRYAGFYNGGELGGTCAIRFDPEDDNSIADALAMVSSYNGEYMHIIAGDEAVSGNDFGEVVISEATVLAKR